ncbi:MAG: putative 2OG-Fe(II) oxygenase [Lysobacteraceae bacterium]
MYEVVPAFAVPLVFAKMPDCEALNAELRELFLARAEDDRYRHPTPLVQRNEALFESNFRLFEWPQESVQRLRTFCLGMLYRAIGELNGYDIDTLKRLHVATEAWFHIARRGGYFGAHTHPLHSWSGVYCVSHRSDDPNSESGKLVMLNPLALSASYLDMGIAQLKPPYGNAHRRYRLSPGDLVLFPSWLLHEVMPFEGDDPRITVAFNARFQLEGAQRAELPVG